MSSVSIFIFKGSDKVPATKRQRKQPSNVGVGRGAGGKKIKEAQGVQGASGGASTNVQVRLIFPILFDGYAPTLVKKYGSIEPPSVFELIGWPWLCT